jgi:hypothetical protein
MTDPTPTDPTPTVNIVELRVNIDGLEKLAKPIGTLFNRITDAIGTLYEPIHMVRIAKSESKVDEIERRSSARLLREQENIDRIVLEALRHLHDDARPEEIEDDFLPFFFGKAKRFSSEKMQNIWSRILAEEANKPGTYSKRTLNQLEVIDKDDAELLTALCNFVWIINGDPFPLIFDQLDNMYAEYGLNSHKLEHLDDIGLITYTPIRSFKLQGLLSMNYFGKELVLDSTKSKKGKFDLGKAIFTKTGKQLASLCTASAIDGFYDELLKLLKATYPGVRTAGM